MNIESEAQEYQPRDSKARAVSILRDLVHLDNQGLMGDTPANDVIARARDFLNTLHMARPTLEAAARGNSYASRVGITAGASAALGAQHMYDPNAER